MLIYITRLIFYKQLLKNHQTGSFLPPGGKPAFCLAISCCKI